MWVATIQRAAQGLFFFHTRKVGFLAGIKFGRGFLIERQGADGEQLARWSAPVFYTVNEGSFGLTAGPSSSTTCTNRQLGAAGLRGSVSSTIGHASCS